MDSSLFTKQSPGKLVNITTRKGKDWAFVPKQLPKDYKVSLELWPLLAEAREELARLDGIGRHMPNYNLLLKPLQQREALKSSSLEGTYATPEEMLLYEIEPREPRSGHDRVNAWKEVNNYNKALESGQELLNSIPLSLRLIRDLHRVLMTGVRGHHRDPGNFRKTQVHVGSDYRFIPPPPEKVDECLSDLEKYVHGNNSLDPLVFCFLVHYQFETIHPFLDGNGRVGRLLLSLMIFHWCGLTGPWLYLSAFFDRYKDEYISNLFNVSAKGDFDSWIAYCLKATIAQAKDAIYRCDQMLSVRDQYIQKIAESEGSNTRLREILERLFESPAVTIPQIIESLGVSYPTARKDVATFERLEILREFPEPTRPKMFIAPEILRIAHSDME